MKISLNKQYILNGAILIALTVLFLSDQALAHGMSEAEKQSIIDGGNWSYLWLGATHMLTGYDHLAFVFGIIFFLTNFRDIVKYVTAFTVGHSVTLISATFIGIQLNYFLIDAVIGLSVCYIAFANLDGFRKYINIKPPNMLVMIVGLGLIHGFGLSTRLQQLPLDPDNLLLNIITFNIGVELGQVSALALMLLTVSVWRNRESFKPFSLATNYGLIILGGFLFLMQMHDYSHENVETKIAAIPPSGIVKSAIASVEKPKNISSKSEWVDSISVTIPGRGDKEFKLRVMEGKTLEYSWSTNGEELFFDFHGEPEGDKTGSFKSYRASTDNQANGSVKAPFTGTHGWYWKNSGNKPVIITLNVRGDFQRIDK
ncbi:MAG: HupE/UreJ family protein [Magnetococcales bacterium]|nr:HupE/UreJ family protein [Magnetococcales bacterium]